MKHQQDPYELRQRLGMTQEQFWGALQVTQSCGSRYESGREMPAPVCALMRVVYAAPSNALTVTREDSEVLAQLKAGHPQIYRALRNEIRRSTKRAEQRPGKSRTRLIRQATHMPSIGLRN